MSKVRKAKIKILVVAFVITILTTAFVTASIFNETMRELFFTAAAYYGVCLMALLHVISEAIHDIKYSKYHDTLNHDEILMELEDIRYGLEKFKDQYSDLIPDSKDTEWKAHPDFDNRIMGCCKDGKSYVITCPTKLRDLLIKFQNNLGGLFHERGQK